MSETKPFLPDFQGVWDLAKIGTLFYLLGLFVTFVYYTQFHLLAVDLLKANAIVLGVYLWAYADLLPRLLLLLVNNFRKPRTIYFGLLTPIAYGALLYGIHPSFDWPWAIFTGISSALTLLYFIGPGTSPAPAAGDSTLNAPRAFDRLALFVTIMAPVFAFAVYSRLPQYIGGGHPMMVKVQVKPEDSVVVRSRFINEKLDREGCYRRDLLYESDKDYYFIEPVTEATTGQVFEVRIHKIKKESVRKIIFTKPNWLTY